jgi:hypothetical protein
LRQRSSAQASIQLNGYAQDKRSRPSYSGEVSPKRLTLRTYPEFTSLFVFEPSQTGAPLRGGAALFTLSFRKSAARFRKIGSS